MKNHSFSVKQDIEFGVGIVEKLGEYIQRLHGTRVLLVSDPGLVKAGITGRVERIIGVCRLPLCDFY